MFSDVESLHGYLLFLLKKLDTFVLNVALKSYLAS